MKSIEAKKYLLSIGFDDAHLPELFNDDDKSYYSIPELMEEFAKQAVNASLEEAAEINYEKYRELTDASSNQKNKRDALKLKDMARGFKYAAKNCQSLKR